MRPAICRRTSDEASMVAIGAPRNEREPENADPRFPGLDFGRRAGGLDPCQPNDALLFTCTVTLGEKLPNETSYRVGVSEVLTHYCQVQNQQNREAGGRLVLISCPEG